MLKNQNIICISSIDWDFVWQGHQEIMSTFARSGNKVLFIENTGVRPPGFKDVPRLHKRTIDWFKSVKGFRRESENLFIYSPLVLPFQYSRFARRINKYLLLKPLRRWMKVMKFRDPIIWTFLPTGTALDIINNIDNKLSVYYCIADFSKLVSNPKKVEKTEKELVAKCDIVFAQGTVLSDKCLRFNDAVHIFPFGVRIADFENFRPTPHQAAEDIKNIRAPVIGYIGGIHRHLDFELLEYIARSRPDWSMVLVGPLQTDISRIAGLKNVFFLGKKEFSELPNYISEFSVGIIPYLRSGYTETVYPTKLNEYHALGKPVISTDLPEVVNFNSENGGLVAVAASKEEFMKMISAAIDDPGDSGLKSRRIASAKKNSWARRIDEMSGLIEEAFEKKTSTPADWTQSFVKMYKKTSRTALKSAAAVLAVYLMLFYTPLVWILAGPLKISQEPLKSDCIVVFAGGVGESGKAGQGFEERVNRAVELYKEGYAGKILFSSGYKYFFDEVLVMKALAVSFGVPENAIILEDKAKNTVENVKFSTEILDKNHMNSILLVSSPYHMLRAKLVFNKISRNISVTCTPVNDSLFYAVDGKEGPGKKFGKMISTEQIKGIVHEYMGILYYWWKGKV
ncbi:MAG: ElyC/SanA/YdcF family protein [Candidatus Omnitrophota bacterium]|nr:ElyC/SanA/YdcF family protein [Candidatus Omnitrophota bacterium]